MLWLTIKSIIFSHLGQILSQMWTKYRWATFLLIKVSENWPWNLLVAYRFATAEAKSKQKDVSSFDCYYGFELYFEIKIILFLPAVKKRSKTLSFNHCIMEIASSIPWKAVKIRARDTKRKKSEASSFKQFSQRLLDNEVFQHSLKILLWQKPKHPSSAIYTQQVGIWDIVQILPVGITGTSSSAFNSDYPALQSKI